MMWGSFAHAAAQRCLHLQAQAAALPSPDSLRHETIISTIYGTGSQMLLIAGSLKHSLARREFGEVAIVTRWATIEYLHGAFDIAVGLFDNVKSDLSQSLNEPCMARANDPLSCECRPDPRVHV